MHFSKSVIAVSASLFSLGFAADGLAFTSWPNQIQSGKPVTLTWSGADPNQPVTIGLRKGSSTDMKEVETVTAEANGDSFTWTPGDNIQDGNDYAFEILQGGQRNYSGQMKGSGDEAHSSSSSQSSQSGSTTTSGSTSSSTTGTSSQTTTTGSKPLISSSGSASPSSSPASTSMVTSSVTKNGPAMTSIKVAHGKAPEKTGSAQNSGATFKPYSLELAVGVLGLVVYFCQ